MSKAKTPSFIAEFEVKTTSKDRRVVRKRREAARQLYNAVLGESLRRLAKLRKDPDFALAKAMPKGKARTAAFSALTKHHEFNEYAMHQHPSVAKACWIRGHLDVHAAQKIATRAFKTAERFSFGKSGRPRFKRLGELESVEGKSNAAGIRYRSGHILWNGEFAKLELPLIVKPGDQVHAHALKVAEEGKVKYVRLLSRTIRREERVFAQLVLEGDPWTKVDAKGDPKHPVRVGVTVGMDLGPSKVAVVTEGQVASFAFCAGLERKEAARRRYLRHLDRQRRANNPGNFNVDGTVKKGRKDWKVSGRQKTIQNRLANVFRTQAAHRKSIQGALAHEVLALGNQIITEKVDKRSWAKLFGRSVGHKAPGMFEMRVGTLAKASGGDFEQVSTPKTFLSSRCLCGKRKKKPLSERKHMCGCTWVPDGTYVDRDEFSAFLALFSQGSALDEGRSREAWIQWGADSLLRSSSDPSQMAPGKALPSRRARDTRKSDSTEHRSGQRRKVGPIRGRRALVGSIPSKTRQSTLKKGDPDAA